MKTMLFSLGFLMIAGCYVQEPGPTTPHTGAAVSADTGGDEGVVATDGQGGTVVADSEGTVVTDGQGGTVVTDGEGVVATDGQGNVVVDDGAGNRVVTGPNHVVVAAAPAPAPGPHDTHPRVMFWPGKVNLHYDVRLGRWMTDPDGVSGAGVNVLQYCRKFYPRTVGYRAYREEWSDAWRDRGNVGRYESIKMSYLCLQR